MSSDSKAGSSQEGSNGAKTKRKKKKSPEEYFGSEVDIKLRGLINPAESADLPPHKVSIPQFCFYCNWKASPFYRTKYLAVIKKWPSFFIYSICEIDWQGFVRGRIIDDEQNVKGCDGSRFDQGKSWGITVLVSISPTFYEQLICQFRFVKIIQ